MTDISITLDGALLVAVSMPLFVIVGALIKNAVSISAASVKSAAAATKVDALVDTFNEYRVTAAATFASNASLKLLEDRLLAGMAAIGVTLERHNERLDRVLQSRTSGGQS